LLIADVENSFYSVIAKNVESVMRELGYRVVLCNDNDDPDEEREYLTLLQGMEVDGLIVTPTPESRTLLERLQQRGMSIVQIDRRVPGFKSDAVVVDNERITREAVSHLIECGHRDIGMLTGPVKVSTAKERLRGYKRALSDHGIGWRPELVRAGSFRRDHSVQDALELIEATPRPTALFGANNILAEACVIALAERKVRIPDGMSLLGFDDMPWMSLIDPPLTTVRQPIAQMATAAAEMLLHRLEAKESGARTMMFHGELVVRGSVRARE
jgi:LacI family transcriptional regulator